MRVQILLFIGALSIGFLSFGQVTNQGRPLSWKVLKEKQNIPVYQLPTVDIEQLKAEDEINDKLAKPWRFGYKHTVSYGLEDGQWSVLPNGDRVWRIEFYSPNALSLNFIFDEFFMPEGGKLYLYSENHKELLGAYTETQNQESGVLATWLVNSDKVIVEYFEPAEVQGEGRLHIGNITHGYRNAKTFKQQKALNSSGDCNVDVDCPIGADWQAYKDLNKKAVGILLSGGSGFCSGALVNNTANDGTPYFLTANHCYSDPTQWAFRFEWISPTPDCATTAPSQAGPTTKTISGATLRAKNANSDFCLVEINSAIPSAWDLTWAGWDHSDTPPSYVVGIHHPSGDVMKVSRDDTGPVQAVNAGAQTWEITTAGGGWEIGVTEPGSSGSPLFDNNGRVIGQLYGGGAACSGTTDNGQLDYYGRFGVSWDGSSSATRLKDWLDPSNSNIPTLDAYPPLQPYALDASVSVDIPEVQCPQTTVQPSIILFNRGTTNLTSATIVWSINGGANTTINWTGNLAQNQSQTISLGTLSEPSGVYNISASVSSPNNGTDENTSNDTNSASYTIDSYQTTTVNLSLLTDDYGSETTWEFRTQNGTVLYSNPSTSYSNATQYNESFSVTLGNCYEFEIFDDAGDGICCGYGQGAYSLTTDNGTVIKQGGDFGSSEVTKITIASSSSISQNNLENIKVYPQPVNDILNIEGYENSQYKYILLNTLSQVVASGVFTQKGIIQTSSLPQGMYLLQIENKTNNQSTIKKIIVQ